VPCTPDSASVAAWIGTLFQPARGRFLKFYPASESKPLLTKSPGTPP
jgi:hypothetical protein